MKIIVTGILGQDGANMVEYLLKNTTAEIYGMIRRSSNPNFINCLNFIGDSRFKLVYGDLSDSVSIDNLVREIQPDYFINFAAQSFVGCSWNIPLQTFDTNATGVVRCLEAIRRFKPNCRFYSAGSSEEFGDVSAIPQDITHPIRPRSPYGASKAAARHAVKVYRESYNLYAIHGILFNHEGTKRGEEFVTRKITKGVARIYHALKNNKTFNPIELGNLDAKRDWSDSEDFVDGVWKMLNQEIYRKEDFQPELYREESYSKNLLKNIKDYVLSSDETHSIREFIEIAFNEIGIEGVWHGTGILEEYSISTKYAIANDPLSSVLIKVNEKFYRPAEVDLLMGDSTPARTELNWLPKTDFQGLVKKMVAHDISLLDKSA
jgi:GDPmannose 4,6-dehydratase